MLPVSRTVIEVLQEGCWEYEGHPGEQGASFPVEGDTDSWKCLALADDFRGYVAFYSVAPVEIFIDRLEAIAEYVCRVNSNLVVGNLELDWDDPVVRFKTSFDFSNLDADVLESTPIMRQITESLLHANLSSFEPHLRLIQCIVDGEHPEGALARLS